MRVPSSSSNPVRLSPMQDRAAKRLDGFLAAAESLFAEAGFEAVTMTTVAERSGSSIGSLYRYFPDKPSLARALAHRYAKELEQHWTPLFAEMPGLSAKTFAERFLDSFLEFVQAHPAYLQLQAAPIRLRRDPETRRAFRVTLQRAVQSRVPALSDSRAYLCADTILQITKGMVSLYAGSTAVEKQRVVAEFKTVLTLYLKAVFAGKAGA